MERAARRAIPPATRCAGAESRQNGGGGRSAIETDCVWSSSGKKVLFNETQCPLLSTVDAYSAGDFHAKHRSKGGNLYEVSTISLNDMLEKHGSPREIDYLSIDTEGSELEILSHLDFDKYRIRAITCEHNYAPIREGLHRLLASKGYRRKFEDFTGWDDWYTIGREA